MGGEALTDKAVARIIKRSIIAAETLNGATAEEAETAAARFAGHSLRSGLATSASANDAPGQAIQRQLRHKKFRHHHEIHQGRSAVQEERRRNGRAVENARGKDATAE